MNSPDKRAESDGSRPDAAPPKSTDARSHRDSASLTDRVQSSATGLFRSTASLGRGGGGVNGGGEGEGDDVSATLAASLSRKTGGDGGGAGSSSSTAQVPRNSTTHQSPAVGETFRDAGAVGSTADADLETFARGGGWPPTGVVGEPAPEPFEEHKSPEWERGKGKLKVSEREDADGAGATTQIQQPDSINPIITTTTPAFEQVWQPTTTITTTPPDGHAVSSLLSDPSFQPLYSHPSDLSNHRETDDDDVDPAMTPNPFIPAPTPASTTTNGTQHINSRSLIPGLAPSPFSSSSAAAAPHSSETHTPTPDDGTADLATLADIVGPDDDWLALDALYHDAVYGNYLLPYVRDAAREVRAYDEAAGAAGDEKTEALREGAAVRRLRMVLGHVRREMGSVGTETETETKKQGREGVGLAR